MLAFFTFGSMWIRTNTAFRLGQMLPGKKKQKVVVLLRTCERIKRQHNLVMTTVNETKARSKLHEKNLDEGVSQG